jgi:hypothetical protein
VTGEILNENNLEPTRKRTKLEECYSKVLFSPTSNRFTRASVACRKEIVER